MFDINNIINTAIATAVAEAIKPLTAQVQCMDTDMTALKERIDTLEKNEEALVRRIAALENNPAGTPATITADAFVTHLDNQEWFWEKLTRKAHKAAEAAVEEAMDSHCSDYDHDNYDTHLGDDDKHFDGDIEDAVRDALNGTSVTLSF